MSYTKQNFIKGQILKAEHLNAMDAGIEANDVAVSQLSYEVEELQNSGITEETDPTVPDWAKQPTKPTYTAAEVGALDSDTLETAIDNALAQAKASGEFDGEPGAAGTTPVRGTDFWTAEDQESIVQQVLAALGAIPVFGRVDENNDIILTAALADGVYTLKYVDTEGNTTVIGTLEHNYVPTDPDTPVDPEEPEVSVEIPMTWEHGVVLDKNTGGTSSGASYSASNFTEVNPANTYTLTRESAMYNSCNIVWYDASGGFVSYVTLDFASLNASTASNPADLSRQLVIPANAAKFRLRLWYETTQIDGATAASYYKLIEESSGGGEEEPTYTNLFVADTCQLNKRTNSSGNVSNNNGGFLTDYIDLGDAMASGGTNVLHYKNMYFHTQNWIDGSYEVYGYICYYDQDKNFLKNDGQRTIADVLSADGDYTKTLDATQTTARYIRISALILPNPSTTTQVTALTSIDQIANCKIALNQTITD